MPRREGLLCRWTTENGSGNKEKDFQYMQAKSIEAASDGCTVSVREERRGEKTRRRRPAEKKGFTDDFMKMGEHVAGFEDSVLTKINTIRVFEVK